MNNAARQSAPKRLRAGRRALGMKARHVVGPEAVRAVVASLDG